MDIISTKIMELYKLMSKMSQDVILVAVLPEFGLRWRDMTKIMYKNHLEMTSKNIAQVLCEHISATMAPEELDEIFSKLQLKLIATQDKTWYVFKLLQQKSNEPVTEIIDNLTDRIECALRSKLKNKRAVVEITMMGDLVYISVQIYAGSGKSTTQYFATAPGEPVLLSCSSSTNTALKACAEGLGYGSCEYAVLYGYDIHSLLRITNGAWTAEVQNLTTPVEYNPTPVITKNGIDYTNKQYNAQYIDNLIGPDPPLLTELTINSSKTFYDPNILEKMFNIKLRVKTDNLAGTLKSWAVKGAIEPTSELFKIFHTCKSNCIEYSRDSD